MSWSVTSFGKPAAVKTALAKQFESAKISTKNIPHEAESVVSIEKIVNDQLDFLANLKNPGVVKVDANGSAYLSTDGTVGNTQVSVSVMPMNGFVE